MRASGRRLVLLLWGSLGATGCTALVSNDFTRGPGPEATAGAAGVDTGGSGGAPAGGDGGATAGMAGTSSGAGAGGSGGIAGQGNAAGSAGNEAAGAAGASGVGASGGVGGSAGASPGGKDCMPKGPCPSICANGCAAGACEIDCAGEGACKDAKEIKCPDGYVCTIVCGGKDSCAKAKLTCSACGQCRVLCTGVAACDGTDIRTGKNGVVECGDAVDACKDVKIHE